MKKFLAGLVVILLTACTGLVKPVTMNDKLVYAANLASSITVSASELYKRGEISQQTALEIIEQLDKVDLVLSNARIAAGINDFKSAQSYLDTVNKILLNLEQQLKATTNGKLDKSSKASFWSSISHSSSNQYFILSPNSV